MYPTSAKFCVNGILFPFGGISRWFSCSAINGKAVVVDDDDDGDDGDDDDDDVVVEVCEVV